LKLDERCVSVVGNLVKYGALFDQERWLKR